MLKTFQQIQTSRKFLCKVNNFIDIGEITVHKQYTKK